MHKIYKAAAFNYGVLKGLKKNQKSSMIQSADFFQL